MSVTSEIVFFFLGILLNVPPSLLIHLGCVLALTMGTTTEMPLYQGCVCAGGPGQGHLGRINSHLAAAYGDFSFTDQLCTY